MPTIECAVWFSGPMALTENRLALLDGTELERLHAYRREPDRQRFLTGRVLTKTVLAGRLERAPEKIQLDSGCPECGRPHGAPRLLEEGAPVFSISHSGDRVALAITDGTPVGVDVEQVAATVQDGMHRHVLNAAEQLVMDQLPANEQVSAFFTYWTRKEALVKACRRGIALPMPQLTVTGPGESARLLSSESPDLDPARTGMRDLEPGEHYRASVAALTGESLRVTTHWFTE
ncbi:MAG: 4'-phosphopantetheinyl transferase superfamily protein [Pseudonocardiaceae bacterium]|nr:4'-phosphopantetheinyl transferase superfamily protein [Pseudonocardiaceae bacterium]